MIRGKYGEEQGECTKEVRDGYGVGWWKAIRKEWHLVSSRFSFMVGNGWRVRFWKDKWCGSSPFCDSFPSLFALVVSKNAWVNDVWSSTNGEGSWNLHFCRPFNDWEVDEVDKFLLSLNGKSVQWDDDRVLWTETKCGKFFVKSLYKALEPGSTISFPLNIIWKSCVHPKVSFFGWEATWGKALTLDQIQKRGWLLVNRCYLGQMHGESIDHILLHCANARTL